ncbi:TPA: phosphoribosyltransferase [Candidatus Berkelbacteria bacterium]|nr:phosphoribosyltransferase [Candidatus Berkelbacteria bacterium]
MMVGLHVVYTSGKHGQIYVNKDAVYPHTHDIAKLGQYIAAIVDDKSIDVVVGPTVGGVILSQWVAYHLSNQYGREVLAVFAEKNLQAFYKGAAGAHVIITQGSATKKVTEVLPGQTVLIDDGTMIFKRGYDKLIVGKRVLVVDDILTTGGTIAKVISAVKKIGGIVVAAACMTNCGKVTAEMIDAPNLTNLIEVDMESYEAADCPLCKDGVPITK